MPRKRTDYVKAWTRGPDGRLCRIEEPVDCFATHEPAHEPTSVDKIVESMMEVSAAQSCEETQEEKMEVTPTRPDPVAGPVQQTLHRDVATPETIRPKFSGAFLFPIFTNTRMVLLVQHRDGRWGTVGGKNDSEGRGCWKLGLGEEAGQVAVREAREEFGPILAAKAARIEPRTRPDAIYMTTAFFGLPINEGVPDAEAAKVFLRNFVPNGETVRAGCMPLRNLVSGFGDVTTLDGIVRAQIVREITMRGAWALYHSDWFKAVGIDDL